jgi:hypothetical protein
MDASTFDYIKPTDAQNEQMVGIRKAFKTLMDTIHPMIPEGPDKTHVIRSLRTCAMWANIAITRQPDGSPRKE